MAYNGNGWVDPSVDAVGDAGRQYVPYRPPPLDAPQQPLPGPLPSAVAGIALKGSMSPAPLRVQRKPVGVSGIPGVPIVPGQDLRTGPLSPPTPVSTPQTANIHGGYRPYQAATTLSTPQAHSFEIPGLPTLPAQEMESPQAGPGLYYQQPSQAFVAELAGSEPLEQPLNRQMIAATPATSDIQAAESASHSNVELDVRSQPSTVGPTVAVPVPIQDTSLDQSKAGQYDDGLIPVEKSGPPDHEGLIPHHPAPLPPPKLALDEASSTQYPSPTVTPPTDQSQNYRSPTSPSPQQLIPMDHPSPAPSSYSQPQSLSSSSNATSVPPPSVSAAPPIIYPSHLHHAASFPVPGPQRTSIQRQDCPTATTMATTTATSMATGPALVRPQSPALYTPAAFPARPQTFPIQGSQVTPSTTHPLPPSAIPSTPSQYTPQSFPQPPTPKPSKYSGASNSLSGFTNSVFSKDTVKWSKKTASRFGGAIKNAATTAHAAATNAQVAAAQAAALHRQKSQMKAAAAANSAAVAQGQPQQAPSQQIHLQQTPQPQVQPQGQAASLSQPSMGFTVQPGPVYAQISQNNTGQIPYWAQPPQAGTNSGQVMPHAPPQSSLQGYRFPAGPTGVPVQAHPATYPQLQPVPGFPNQELQGAYPGTPTPDPPQQPSPQPQAPITSVPLEASVDALPITQGQSSRSSPSTANAVSVTPGTSNLSLSEATGTQDGETVAPQPSSSSSSLAEPQNATEQPATDVTGSPTCQESLEPEIPATSALSINQISSPRAVTEEFERAALDENRQAAPQAGLHQPTGAPSPQPQPSSPPPNGGSYGAPIGQIAPSNVQVSPPQTGPPVHPGLTGPSTPAAATVQQTYPINSPLQHQQWGPPTLVPSPHAPGAGVPQAPAQGAVATYPVQHMWNHGQAQSWTPAVYGGQMPHTGQNVAPQGTPGSPPPQNNAQQPNYFGVAPHLSQYQVPQQTGPQRASWIAPIGHPAPVSSTATASNPVTTGPTPPQVWQPQPQPQIQPPHFQAQPHLQPQAEVQVQVHAQAQTQILQAHPTAQQRQSWIAPANTLAQLPPGQTLAAQGNVQQLPAAWASSVQPPQSWPNLAQSNGYFVGPYPATAQIPQGPTQPTGYHPGPGAPGTSSVQYALTQPGVYHVSGQNPQLTQPHWQYAPQQSQQPPQPPGSPLPLAPQTKAPQRQTQPTPSTVPFTLMSAALNKAGLPVPKGITGTLLAAGTAAAIKHATKKGASGGHKPHGGHSEHGAAEETQEPKEPQQPQDAQSEAVGVDSQDPVQGGGDQVLVESDNSQGLVGGGGDYTLQLTTTDYTFSSGQDVSGGLGFVDPSSATLDPSLVDPSSSGLGLLSDANVWGDTGGELTDDGGLGAGGILGGLLSSSNGLANLFLGSSDGQTGCSDLI
ncbi:uncharacterized protein C8A04DRAFT_33295 [Dichotomopilus funicola]|uniref:Uncharacterized protein n=1 Tax=Dichotomopilus funicola TaxID=1934379 RepID=A0AAN6UVA8_9PEZI|nr:hypothetical protein C8A04DRAFT_33295 [Dichotomopilus funicola]